MFDKSCKEINEKDKTTMVRQRHQLIPSRDIDDQRILGSNWTKDTLGHIQSRMVVLDATFP